MTATVNRVRRTTKDWRLLVRVRRQLWGTRLASRRHARRASSISATPVHQPSEAKLSASIDSFPTKARSADDHAPGRTREPDRPRATVIIVSFNTRSLLGDCLSSLRAWMPDVPVAVIDNASADESATMVAQAFPDVKLIRNQSNLGFGAANNRALAEVNTEFVLLLNSDARVDNDIISTLTRTMDEHPEAGMVGCRLVSPDGTTQRSARPFPSVQRSLRNALALSDPMPPTLTEVDYVDSAAALARTHALREVSGFDERFFLYAEDADLCRRLKQAGWRTLYDPGASVVHVGGASTLRGSAEDDRLRWESTALYAATHFGGMEYAAFFVVRAIELLRQSVTSAARAALSADPVARRKCRTALRELRWHAGYLRASKRGDGRRDRGSA